VRVAAAAFRVALETTPDLCTPSLARFPRGACGDVSELLGQYLRDAGLGTWLYRSGVKHEPAFASHAWIESEGLIVDITADQFPAVREPVIVAAASAWHAAWESGPARRPADLSYFGPGLTAARQDYAILRATADALNRADGAAG